MNNHEVAWTISFRADRLQYVPTELQEFASANVLNVASLINFYYPTEKNNGQLSCYKMYDAPSSGRPGPIKSFPGTLVAVVKEDISAANRQHMTVFVNFAQMPLLAPLTNVKTHKVGDTTYYTQLDPTFIDYLGDILDLEDIVGKNITVSTHLEAYNFKSSSNAELTNQVMSKHSCWVDGVGSIAVLPDELAEKFKEKFKDAEPAKVRALKTASLFKGTSPYFGPDQQSIANLASGGRFFLYSTKIEVILNGEKSEVPFIGLAVFGGEKLVRYKNALSLIERLQNFSDSIRTQSVLYPEKYNEIIKAVAPPIAQYWPGILTHVPEKSMSKSKLNIVDASAIKPDDPNKFKAFFINNVLQKTPEAARFLAMKAKHDTMEKRNKEMQAVLKAQEDEIVRLRRTIEASIAEVTRLQILVRDSLTEVDDATTKLTDTKPQAERATNASLEILAALQPLEADYLNAVSKYWDQEANLDILKAWESEGFIIKDIALYDRDTGRNITRSEEIRNAMSKGNIKNFFISKIVIVTTKPSIIYKDAHRVGREKATQHAAGPFTITISCNVGGQASMSVRLLDDRSLRGVWSSSGYKYFKAHPHVQHHHIYESDYSANPSGHWTSVTNKEFSACMGEFQPIAYKAMTEMTLQPLIYGLKGWLETADSGDTYGAYVKYFPYAKDVVIDRFGPVREPELNKLEAIKPVFSKQHTFIKRDETKATAMLFLSEGTKLIAIEAEGEIKDNTLKLTEKTRSVMMFLSSGQRESALNESRAKLEADGYSLFAEQKAVPDVSFSFPFVERPVTPLEAQNVTPEGEIYRPAAARRATEAVINDLQALVEAPTNPAPVTV